MKTTTIFQKTAVIFAMFVFIVFAFSACSSDDDSDDPISTPVADAIVGTWNAVSLEATGDGSLPVPLLGNVSYTATGVASNLNCNLVITETPNNITSNGTYDMEVDVDFSYSYLNYTDTFTDLPFTADGSWSRSGADLSYIINDAAIKEGTIILNNNDRQLVITFNETHGAVNLDVEVTFVRQ